ncbi:MAG: biosynthetic arginine decarboxylase, partial [Planctomycetota bacterium]
MTPPDTLEQASRDSHAPTPRPASDWTTADAAALYGLEGWAGGYFRVGRGGTLEVTPHGDAHDTAAKSIDLVELTEGLRQRGIGTPVLIRFPEIVEHRMRSIRAAFDRAIEQEQYQGGYTCVYPIKVNQQRHLAETIRDIAGSVGFGLEAGSKPELLAVLGLTERRGAMPIVCNGFKDDEYVETVILAHKLGRDITTVIEGRGELTRLLSHADRYGVRPQIGVRVKPAAIGGGRWAESAGERSKFGLHASEVLTALERLKDRGMADCLSLVHFHIGSQLCEMRHIKQAISELARFFCELRRLGAGVHTIDVGGGLAIDYDGSQSAWSSSADYSLDEYATDIVYRIKAACDDAGQPHPRIISESGRAMVAHSSVLVFDVLGRSSFCEDPGLEEIRTQMEGEKQASGEEVPQPIRDLVDAYELAADPEKLNEAAHDATQARDEAMSLFNLGYLSLPMRAAA